MPIGIKYLEDGGIIAKGEGVVTGDDFKETNDIIYKSIEKINKITYQICDLSNVSGTSISKTEIETLAEMDKNAAGIKPGMIIALVCREDLLFGLARMWEALSDMESIETSVFRKVEEAHQWIKEKMQ